MTATPESVTRYPLDWPLGWKRTRSRVYGRFSSYGKGIPRSVALERLESETQRIGAKDATLSSNLPLRVRGDIRLDVPEPTDPGVALYFNFRGRATVLACDRYTQVAHNIAAIAAHLEALRRIERYGVGTIEQALAGYKALPADTAADWRVAFGFGAEERVTPADLDARFKLMAKDRHPDKTGDDGAAMVWLNRARDYALDELKR